MIPFYKAYNIVTSSARSLQCEIVPLDKTVGRVLSENVMSDTDMPPFNKAAMDGYAMRREDLLCELEVLEVIHAGQLPKCHVGRKQCSKIMTGAQVPEGADCVIMVEHTEIINSKVRFTAESTADNISHRAIDAVKGSVVLNKGLQVKPQHIAILASAGKWNVPVSCRPRVAVISTGDELVEPFEVPGPSQIRNSNAYQ